MNRRDYFTDSNRIAALATACASWRGTPFRERSCVKGQGGGVDCAGFVASVFIEIGAIDQAIAIPPYDLNHAEHSDDSRLRAWFERDEVRARVRRVDEEETPLAGDIVFPVVGRCEHHLGLQLGGIVWHVARPSGVCTMAVGQLKLARSRYRLIEPGTDSRAVTVAIASFVAAGYLMHAHFDNFAFGTLALLGSFLIKQPTLPQSAPGVDPKHASGYKAADVVPIGWGSDIFSSKWISGKYDEHTQTAGSNKPEWQYCSIAARYRRGPIRRVGKVFRDGKLITDFGYTFADGEESHTFTINAALASGRAWTAVVHRGTEDADPSITANLNAKTGQNHPPMRGYAWIEWINIDLGQSTALPSLAVEMSMETPEIDDFPATLDNRYGVNLFAAAYAMLLEVTAGDLDTSLLLASHWGAQCQALEDNGTAGRTGTLTYGHPTFTASITLADALSQILAYVDGYIRGRNGQIEVGWIPSAAVDASTLPEIAEQDLDAKPTGPGIPDWNEGATSVVVTFKSIDKDYGEDAARYNAPANRENNVAGEPERRDRPFIHSSDQARPMAAEGATESSNGDSEFDLSVLKSRAVDGTAILMPGDQINYDYGPHSFDLACRLVSRRLRMGRPSDILTAIRERGAYPRPYIAAVDDRVALATDDPGVINVADQRLWLLPNGLTSVREIAPLINRSKRTIYRCDLHLSTAGAAPWEVILDSRFFAAKGAVNNAGINGVVGTVRIASTSVDWSRMAAQNAVGQADDTLLLLIDDELMSVGSITVVSSGVYDLTILRGRRGTTAAAHALAAVSWLFYRSEIASVEHKELYNVRVAGAYDVTTATKYFKFQLFTPTTEGLAKPDDPGVSFVLPDLTPSELLGYTIVISSEAHTVATDAAGVALAGELGVGSSAFTVVSVKRGNTALTAVAAGPNSDQFSIAIGTLTSTTATKTANDTIRCDTLTANTGTIDITISVAGAFTQTKTFTLTKAVKGATGAAGAAGAAGAVGPGVVYRGAYSAGTAYFHTADRRDIVSSGGSYWLANNTGKSGLTTWGTPGVADWAAFGATFSSVATDILLTVDATILKTLVMGDGATGNAGIIRSAGATAYGTGAGFWMNPRNGTNKTEWRIGDPTGVFIGFDGTTLSATYGSGGAQIINGVSGGFAGTQWTGSGDAFIGVDAQGGYLNLKASGGGGPSMLSFEILSGKLKFTNDANAAWYRSAASTLKTDGHLAVGGVINVPGAVGTNGGIAYSGGNNIAFYWDGSNVKVVVDGTAQGTIPNP